MGRDGRMGTDEAPSAQTPLRERDGGYVEWARAEHLCMGWMRMHRWRTDAQEARRAGSARLYVHARMICACNGAAPLDYEGGSGDEADAADVARGVEADEG